MSRTTLVTVLMCLLVTVCCGSYCRPVTLPQSFQNAAKDTKEAPYVRNLSASTSGGNLVLRFEGDLRLGRQTEARNELWDSTFHHADTTLLITLNNEALVDSIWNVGPDSAGKLLIKPGGSLVSATDEAVTISIPLKQIKYSPLMLSAEIKRTYYINAENMAGGEGRNLFSTATGPAVFYVPGLQAKTASPVVKGLKAAAVTSDSVTLQWTTANRTDTSITLKAEGRQHRVVTQPLLLNSHKLTITDLRPNTVYTASVSGKDIAGGGMRAALLKFRTPASKAAKGAESYWLSVKGKYIVDASGKPYPLGGYSVFPGEIWFDQFPRYGTNALTARNFRNLGLNCCRLGLLSHLPKHWSASIERDQDVFERFGGPEGMVKKYVRPMVDQITGEGMYVIIDWHWSYSMTKEYVELIGRFWEAAAKEFKDDPKVAMYQLLNEPAFNPEGGTTPDIAPLIRTITKDYITRIRKYDKRHIILVPDWNSGWGWATESQWSPVNFDPGDPQKQIVYSKHVAKEHMTDAFMQGGVDSVADRWDVPIMFDEAETGPLQPPAETLWFYRYLTNNPRKWSFAIWVAGQYWPEFPTVTAAFAQNYLRQVPWGVTGEPPIVNWWYIDKSSETQKDGKYCYRFATLEAMPGGDYGVAVLGAEVGDTIEVAVAAQPGGELQGVYLGYPTVARWRGFQIVSGQSAVDRATYIHPLTTFKEVVIRSAMQINDPKLQLFRLNPKHQHPVPNVETNVVE